MNTVDGFHFLTSSIGFCPAFLFTVRIFPVLITIGLDILLLGWFLEGFSRNEGLQRFQVPHCTGFYRYKWFIRERDDEYVFL